MKRGIGRIFSSLISLLLTLSLSYPQAQEQGRSDEPIKLSAELVLLDVQVLNKETGRVIGGLKQEDFTIYEDGVRQQITHFSQDKLPLSIVLLLDTSGSIRSFTKQMRDGALQALQRLKPEDEVALMATASRTELIQDFTKDRQLIADRIERLSEKALGRGGILLHDAVYQAATHLRRASNSSSRRVIIVVTDNISTQSLFTGGHSKKEALHEVFETGGVVCGLLIGRWKAMKYHPTLIFFNKLFGSGSIDTYANETGGVVLTAKKEEIATKLTELIDHLRTRYTLGYTSSNTKQDGKFRRIKVTLSPEVEKREGKLVILTRRGYYARRK